MDLEPEPEIAFQQQLEHTVTKQNRKKEEKKSGGGGGGGAKEG